MKKLLLHGSAVIHYLTELRQGKHNNDPWETINLFVALLGRVRPLQLMDILNDIGPKIFTRVVESKTL